MEKQVLFTEKQRFTQWWFWLLILVLTGIPTVPLLIVGIKQHYTLQQYLTEASNPGIIILLLVVIFLLIHRLDTQITNEGICVRLFPYHLKFQSFPQKIIGLAYVRKYNSLGEYGGFGLRLNGFGYGKAYNISGKKGIQLVFKDGSKLLIGTRKPEEASAVLQQAGYLQAEVGNKGFEK